MRLFNYIAMVALAASMVVGLGACGKKKNGSSAASTPASTCTRHPDGQLRDQYGRLCSSYPNGSAACINARYDVNTRQYIDITTGAVVACNGNYYDGYNSMPYYGQYGGQQINGCQGWSRYYPAYYIPVDLGNGQLVCMNTAYLGQQTGYGQNYFQNYYYSQRPVYTCYSYDCHNPGYYGGYQYGCNANINLGGYFGNFYGSVGLCL